MSIPISGSFKFCSSSNRSRKSGRGHVKYQQTEGNVGLMVFFVNKTELTGDITVSMNWIAVRQLGRLIPGACTASIARSLMHAFQSHGMSILKGEGSVLSCAPKKTSRELGEWSWRDQRLAGHFCPVGAELHHHLHHQRQQQLWRLTFIKPAGALCHKKSLCFTSSLARFLGRMFDHLSPACAFFFSFFF